MEITRVSEATGIEHTRWIDVDEGEYLRWSSGETGFIQDVFPHLSDDDREFLLTGVTPEEWDEMFADVEEDIASDWTDYPEPF